MPALGALVDTVRGVGYMAVQPRQPRSAPGGSWRNFVGSRERNTGPEGRRRITSGSTGAGRLAARSSR
ncbi:MAG: hypothetical protein JO044_00645 [Mycobacteriaceae bacterium]|nr:hypothetical protein [Mycobacteriaceae bacterium]MBV9640098.1 hypothetical protein [Mycobacteriaceae bacterium]